MNLLQVLPKNYFDSFFSQLSTAQQGKDQSLSPQSLQSLLYSFLRSDPKNIFEHVNATQCVTASADFPSSINLHDSKCIMTSVWIRSPPSTHSCENWDYLVLQSYDASCDETYWCYHFCCYGNPAQRYAWHGCPCTASMESEMECPLGTDKRIRAQGKILIILRKN